MQPELFQRAVAEKRLRELGDKTLDVFTTIAMCPRCKQKTLWESIEDDDFYCTTCDSNVFKVDSPVVCRKIKAQTLFRTGRFEEADAASTSGPWRWSRTKEATIAARPCWRTPAEAPPGNYVDDASPILRAGWVHNERGWKCAGFVLGEAVLPDRVYGPIPLDENRSASPSTDARLPGVVRGVGTWPWPEMPTWRVAMAWATLNDVEELLEWVIAQLKKMGWGVAPGPVPLILAWGVADSDIPTGPADEATLREAQGALRVHLGEAACAAVWFSDTAPLEGLKAFERRFGLLFCPSCRTHPEEEVWLCPGCDLRVCSACLGQSGPGGFCRRCEGGEA